MQKRMATATTDCNQTHMATTNLATSTVFDAGRWAAEDLALQLGWLSECPYHGEPFKTAARAQNTDTVLAVVDPASELYALAARLTKSYSEHCPFCERESTVPE
jgi:hypothetical protein